jgi:hypothetical protein
VDRWTIWIEYQGELSCCLNTLSILDNTQYLTLNLSFIYYLRLFTEITYNQICYEIFVERLFYKSCQSDGQSILQTVWNPNVIAVSTKYNHVTAF